MEISKISREIHENNIKKGFWDEERNTGEALMLIVSEASEALECDRKDKRADSGSVLDVLHYLDQMKTDPNRDEMIKTSEGFVKASDKMEGIYSGMFKKDIKDTFEDELADICIRTFDLAEGMGIDLEKHILMKTEYNKTRPHKHGKKY